MTRVDAIVSAVLALVCTILAGRSGAGERPRIVTLGSAITETAFALGAGDDVVGVDATSVHPDAARGRAQLGYLRQLSAEGILSLRPSLVLASAEAGPPAVIEQLRSAGVRVVVAPAGATLDGVRARIRLLGDVLDRREAAARLDEKLRRDATALEARRTRSPRARVLCIYARGSATMLVSGRGTACDAALRLAGAENAIDTYEGYRPLTSEGVVAARPDAIVVPTRGAESAGGVESILARPGVALTPAGRARRVVAIDDLLLLGFGPRTVEGATLLASKLAEAMTTTRMTATTATTR